MTDTQSDAATGGEEGSDAKEPDDDSDLDAGTSSPTNDGIDEVDANAMTSADAGTAEENASVRNNLDAGTNMNPLEDGAADAPDAPPLGRGPFMLGANVSDALQLHDGRIVTVGWGMSNDEVELRVLSSSGEPLTSRVLNSDDYFTNELQIEVLADWSFVVGWATNKNFQAPADYVASVNFIRFDPDVEQLGNLVRRDISPSSNGFNLSRGAPGVLQVWCDGSSTVMAARNDDTALTVATDDTGGTYTRPDIVALSNGGFAVSWYDHNPEDGSDDNTLMVRAYDAQGLASPAVVAIGDVTLGSPGVNNTLAAVTGGFVVVNNALPGPNSSAYRVFDSDGSARSEVLRLDTSSATPELSSVLSLSDGGFAVAYPGAYVQAFGAEGLSSGQPVRIDDPENAQDYYPKLRMLPDQSVQNLYLHSEAGGETESILTNIGSF